MSARPDRVQKRSSEGGLSITWLLPLALVALVLATVVPVAVLGFIGARDNTNRLLRDRSELVLDIVVDQIAAHLEPVREQLAYAADAVRQGGLDLRDDATLRAFMQGSLAGIPQVAGLSFVRPDLSVRRHNRSERQGHEVTYAMLSPVQQSIADGRADPGLRWIGPLWSPSLAQPILAVRVPLTGPADEHIGMLVATVSVAELSRYLAQVAKDIGQTPFILAGRDHVLAHPAFVGTIAEKQLASDESLPRLVDFRDPVLARMWTREARPLSVAQFRRSQGHWSWFDQDSFEAHSYVYRTIATYGATPWTVGIHSPSAETRRERWVVLGVGLGGLLLLALALILAFVIARRLGTPILSLTRAAARIEALDFAGAQTLARGPVREVNQAAAAFERMAVGLGWFETYLPKTLVRRLMAAGPGAPATETREVTVMFTDLEHYSDYAGSHAAGEVVSYLNDLLAIVGPIIEASGGTIDKYIGDSVMAFWGAPEDQPNHAQAAGRAACDIAVEIQAFNMARRATGQHACRMRIGLHTGDVAVGNVGFAGRVDYTIIGRVVNIAQELEQSARTVATGGEVVILTSGVTSTAAGASFSFEPQGDLGPRGAGGTRQLIPPSLVQAQEAACNSSVRH